MGIKVKSYIVSEFGTNCYFVINDETKEMLVIDPGANAEMLAEEIKKEGLTPVGILLTHGHLIMQARRISLPGSLELRFMPMKLKSQLCRILP